jgi:hypothetical protein
VASWHFVIETKGAPHAQRSKKHTKNSEKRFYKSRSSSALRKRHYLLVLELGVTKSLTQNGNNRARRWITGYRHACTSLLEYLLVHIH